MLVNKVHADTSTAISLKAKLRDYGQLIKFRLNITVVLSTFIGFLLGSTGDVNWINLLIVVVGGFLTVGAANGINQIIERDSDKLMRRTENRPLATNRMSLTEAVIACLVMGMAGVLMISLYLNELSGLLSLISLCLYGFVYTPLKKISPIAVYVGAIPGALPPIIGYVAASGEIGTLGWVLFIMQFIWQFPHFYSIAWLLDEDYRRAGLKLMPIGAARNKQGAAQIVFFSVLLTLTAFLPYLMDQVALLTSIALAFFSAIFAYQSFKLYKSLENKDAKRLMFGSIFYLPVIFGILIIDKIF